MQIRIFTLYFNLNLFIFIYILLFYMAEEHTFISNRIVSEYGEHRWPA